MDGRTRDHQQHFPAGCLHRQGARGYAYPHAQTNANAEISADAETSPHSATETGVALGIVDQLRCGFGHFKLCGDFL